MDDMPAGDVGHEIHKKAMAANQSAIDAANKRIAKQGIQYPTGKKQKFTKDKSDSKVAAGRKAAKEMGLLKKEELELFSAAELEALENMLAAESATNPFQVHFDKDGKEYTSKGTKEQRDKITKNREEMAKKRAKDAYKSRAGESD